MADSKKKLKEMERSLLYYKGLLKQIQQKHDQNVAKRSKSYEPPATKASGASFPALVSRLTEDSIGHGIEPYKAKKGALRDAADIWFYYPHREDGLR